MADHILFLHSPSIYPDARPRRGGPRFAKRHYEAIAQAMQEVRTRIRSTPQDQIECVVNILANLFASDNGQFKRDRFKRACELGANVRARS